MTLRPLARTLIVPVLGLSLSALGATRSATKTDPAEAARKVVNINTATAAELARLPRVGEKLAQRIVDHRQQHGAFRRAEDLMEVKGVGEKMFQTLKPYLAVSGPTTLAEKVGSKGSRAPKTAVKSARPAKTPKNAKAATPGPKEGT